MIEFFNRFFGKPTSSATAKERLRLVLLSDHLALAPELVSDLKRELIDVISRYVEVDRSRIEVNFEHQDKAIAMLANIPIVSVHPPTPPAPTPPSDGGGGGNGGESIEGEAAQSTAAAALQTQQAAAKKPRRRRRRPSQSNPAPAT